MDENIKKFKMQCNDIKNQYKDLGQIKELLQNSHAFNRDFEPLNYINAGSCGIVYEGKIKKNGRKIALKFLLNKLLESKRDQKNIQTQERERIARQKLSKEIKIQTKIKHKNITSLYGVYDIQNKGSCMILEYAKYGDLDYFQKKLIKKQTLSETLLVFIASQILTGLYYCHQNKIIHMDIKQQNILICEGLQIKISDFSVSVNYESFPPGSIIPLPLAGTSLFMSPEVLGKKSIPVEESSKVDMFSLGTLLYHLAFGEYPYDLQYEDRKNFEKISDKIKSNSIIIPRTGRYSNLFRRFLERLLNKNIFERLSVEQGIKDPWIKGGEYVFLEKEKVGDLEKFVLSMVSDTVKSFNDYLIAHDIIC